MRDINNNYDDFMAFLADSFEAITRIAADPAVKAVFAEKKPVMTLAKPLCTDHADDIAQIFAALEGVPVDEFKGGFNAIKAFKATMQLLNSPVIKELFGSAGTEKGATSSGSPQPTTME